MILQLNLKTGTLQSMKKKLKHIYSDAGRSITPGFEHEKNDCTVRAISHAFDIDYATAHDAVRQAFNRKDRDGCVLPVRRQQFFLNALLGKKFTVEHCKLKEKKSLSNVIEKFENGVYIVELHDHVFTIKDGVIYDNRFNDRCFPIGYYLIKF